MDRRLWLLAVPIALLGLAAMRQGKVENGNLLKNAGFESGIDGWFVDAKFVAQGTIRSLPEQGRNGSSALALSPTQANSNPANLLSTGQGIAAPPYRGKRLYLSGYVRAESGCRAVVGAYFLGEKNALKGAIRIADEQGASGYTFSSNDLEVPSETQSIIVLCTVEGRSGRALFDDLSLSLTPVRVRAVVRDTKPYAVSVNVHADKVLRTVPASLFGTNLEWAWDGNSMFDPAHRRWRPDVMELAKALRPTHVRFPGGTFSDFYHWREGIVQFDRRPTTAPMPGNDPNRQNVGTDEAIVFANALGSKLLITVNAGTGSPEEAAGWVRYIARKVPIEYWEIGNELYIHDDSPAAKQSGLTPEAYADRASSFIDAIRAVDPQARISAITDENYAPWGNHDWTKVVLNKVGDRIDSLSVHCGYAPVMFGDMGDSVRDVYRALLAAPVLVRGTLQRTDRQIAALPRKDADRIKIAVTEWGPLFQVLPTDRFVDHCKTLGSALYMASAFKAFLDVPRVEAASQFKLSDPLFIGMIGYRDGQPTPNPSYMLMKRLRRLARQKLVRCEVASPTYDSPSIGWVHAVKGVPLFECYVCRQGSRLTLVAINKSLDRPARVSLHGFAGKCRLWTLDGDSIDAHGDASPLSSPGLKWAEQAKDGDGPKRLHVVDRLATIGSVVSFPAHSVSVVEMQ